ncbi:uncharacterized protein BX664DRAFT_339651 [Halteromyces radiatus]|uniref:uncharacterized protein n=1 Tax=Halteromyces radiatus TaxID=101107 RepID=UPI0022203350|nr:uncharacterized protein BX664DRAFT_339651 [Halteromyces radiatus]KAI8083028.1 hypothetical protein BX664DRAFT_339651 [Halteromyces radiatus]
MSNPLHQTRLSLQLRKRNLERSQDTILPNKRQAKEITDIQTKQDLPAFGAPLFEEKKTAKRSTDTKPNNSEEEPKKKRVSRQPTIKELIKQSTNVQTDTSTSSVETKETSEQNNDQLQQNITNQQKQSTALESAEHSSHVVEDDKSEGQSSTKVENLPQQRFVVTQVDNDDDSKATSPSNDDTTIDNRSPDILNTPSPSPTLNIEDQQSSQHESSDTGLEKTTSPPSPDATPQPKRTAPVITKSPESTSTSAIEPIILTSSSSPKQHTISSSLSTSIVYGKSLLPKLEKERIHEERTTLDKLVSALDVTLTFHAARNVAAFFHKIQPMLRNSTKKNITLSHLCKILFVAPELYDVEVKLLKEFGKDVEGHQVSIGHEWQMPLSGKMIQERKELMTQRSGDYFENNKDKAITTIPEKELPRLDKVVDQKKWLEKANLPARVRSVLELQEKRKAAKEEKAARAQVEHQGTAKDRAKALLDRIRNKQKK